MRICANLSKVEASAITLADVADADKVFAGTLFNGDGVIIVESADDEATQRVIREIGEFMGTVPDRSGKAGIDQEKTTAFFAECEAFDRWQRKADAERALVLPLGDATAAA